MITELSTAAHMPSLRFRKTKLNANPSASEPDPVRFVYNPWCENLCARAGACRSAKVVAFIKESLHQKLCNQSAKLLSRWEVGGD